MIMPPEYFYYCYPTNTKILARLTWIEKIKVNDTYYSLVMRYRNEFHQKLLENLKNYSFMF